MITSISARGVMLPKCTLKPCGEQHRAAGLDGAFDLAIDARLGHVGRQHCDQVGLGRGVHWFDDAEAFALGALPARAVLSRTDDDLVPAVAEVHGVGAALAAVADNGHGLAGKGVALVVCFGQYFHAFSSVLD